MQSWILGSLAVFIFLIFVIGILWILVRLMKRTERVMDESMRLIEETKRLMSDVEVRLHALDPIY